MCSMAFHIDYVMLLTLYMYVFYGFSYRFCNASHFICVLSMAIHIDSVMLLTLYEFFPFCYI